jgi:hypothetical protein
MNKNNSGDSSKTNTNNTTPIKLHTSNISKKSNAWYLKKKNDDSPSLSNLTQSIKLNSKKNSILCNKNLQLSILSIHLSAHNSGPKKTHLTSSYRSIDNTLLSSTLVNQLFSDNNSQSFIEHATKTSTIYANINMNFATVTAMKNIPCSEKVIVFSSIELNSNRIHNCHRQNSQTYQLHIYLSYLK